MDQLIKPMKEETVELTQRQGGKASAIRNAGMRRNL